MRTMKKVLALSLVLAMALSMVASAASFKDQATINEDLIEDINLMVALNVFSEDGTGAGYFEPNGTITRAQAAKILYVLKNKGVDNGAASWTGMNIFKDVEVGSWYEGYANYCASTGIMIGTSEGVFTPNGQLTGTELAKMLLVLIGYKADIEGYTGAKWAENIIADAEAAGFFAEYELPVKGIVTREWAAKMIVNAINATKVRYSDGVAVEQYVTTTTDGKTISYPVTYATQDLGLKEYTGMLVATPNIALNGVANNTDGKSVTSKIDGEKADYEFEYNADPALLGQNVTVLVKGSLSTSGKNTDVKVYGVTAHEDVVVADTTVNEIKLATIDNNNKQANLTVNGVTKKITVADEKAKLDVYVDYVLTNDDVAWAKNGEPNKEVVNNAILDGSKAGDNDNRAVKLIDNNGDGLWDIAFINHVVYAKVEKITPAKNYIKLSNENGFNREVNTEEAYADIVFADTVKKDDIVKVTKDYSTGVEKTVIELADVVTGVVTKVTSSNVATMDGVTYNKAASNVLYKSDIGDFKAGKDAQVFYTDGKFVVHYDGVAASNADQSNIAYVIKAGLQSGEWSDSAPIAKVDILKNDGTRETLTYKTYSSNVPSGYKDFQYAKYMEGNLVEYVMVDGKVYFKELNTVKDGDVIVADAVTAKNACAFDKSEGRYSANINGSDKELLINSDSYFFVKSTESGSTKYAVILASELKGDVKVVGGTDKIAYAASGLPYVKYGVLEIAGSAPVDEGKTNVLAIAASSQTHVFEGDDEYWTLNVTNLDGTVVTLKTENAGGFNISALKNKFVKYTISSDGNAEVNLYSFVEDGYTLYNGIEAIDGNTIMIGGRLYTIDKDTKIYYVNSYESATDGVRKTSVVAADDESAEIVVADKDDDGNYLANVVFKANGDKEISHLIVEVDGEELYMNLKINTAK